MEYQSNIKPSFLLANKIVTLDKITTNYCAGMQLCLSDRSRPRCDKLPADARGADRRGDLVQHVVGDQGEHVAAAIGGPVHSALPLVGLHSSLSLCAIQTCHTSLRLNHF